MQVQSGFVLAVLIGAVLLADRLGGTDELARRLFQVALAILLAFTVISATEAFVLGHNNGDGGATTIFGGGEDGEAGAADRLSISNTINAGAGVLALLFGLGGLARYRTVPVGLALGGVLLIANSPGGQLTTYGSLGTYLSSSVSVEAAVVNFAMYLAGLVALLWFGFNQWERPPSADYAEDADEGAEGVEPAPGG